MQAAKGARVNTTRAVTGLSYAVITPVRDERINLERLADSLAAQTTPVSLWVIVDTGSTDGTIEVATRLSARFPWISMRTLQRNIGMTRGAPIVRAFHEGLRAVPTNCAVVIKLDADVSLAPDHFEKLLLEFERDERLGIASGSCYEQDGRGGWIQRHGTGTGVWGAARAYRRDCLDAIGPLEERMGWDTVDLVAAEVRGWRTKGFDVPFRHHRGEGARDASRFAHWRTQGGVAHFMGYRLTYLFLRAIFRAVRDPAAVGIVIGYFEARIGRRETVGDERVRNYIRTQQAWRRVPRRAGEVLRRRRRLHRAQTVE